MAPYFTGPETGISRILRPVRANGQAGVTRVTYLLSLHSRPFCRSPHAPDCHALHGVRSATARTACSGAVPSLTGAASLSRLPARVRRVGAALDDEDAGEDEGGAGVARD